MRFEMQRISIPKIKGDIITYCHLTTFKADCLVHNDTSGDISWHSVLNLNEFISVYLCHQFGFDPRTIKFIT
jgi:hypothetical protein